MNPSLIRTLLAYLGFVLVPAGLGIAVAVLTGDVGGPPEPPSMPPPGEIPGPSRLLLALTVVSLATIAGGLVARWLRQPQVVGQMVAGLLIGPSVLGKVAPGVESWLFPTGTAQILTLFGGIGAIMFVYLVGQDFSLAELRRSRSAMLVLGQGVVAIPFLAGTLLAVSLQPKGVGFTLFMGLAMGVTALPMLAHILRERGLDQTQAGALGIAASVVGDATLWCCLAVTLAVARSTSTVNALVTSGLVAVFALVMWFGGRPALAALDRDARLGSALPAFALSAMLLASLITDSLGADAIFGAFLAGLIVPRSANYRTMNSKIEGLVEWLLLPMFFASIGLQMQLGVLDFPGDLWLCLAVVLVAMASKTAAALLVARVLGAGWHTSSLLAAMVNCRGLTELILLNLGLSAGLLDAKLFTVLTIMTFVTTLLTGPALDLVNRFARRRAERENA